ncbi:hypothetical protein [Streptomyces sp. NPDC059455]|uniref:hypothetical protein n=1 Tax=Streptomyces sp. NPDC059455 TaxID=3346837 RepID=UPI003690E060
MPHDLHGRGIRQAQRSKCAFMRGSLWRPVEDPHVFSLEDGVERLAVLAIAVAQQEAQDLEA